MIARKYDFHLSVLKYTDLAHLNPGIALAENSISVKSIENSISLASRTPVEVNEQP